MSDDDELEERLGPEIPANARPRVQDYGFDLEEALSSVLSIRTHIPDDGFTADTLGTERGGNAALISSDGLVVTIGYLVTEAETVWLFDGDGKAIPAMSSDTIRRLVLASCRPCRSWTCRHWNSVVLIHCVLAIRRSLPVAAVSNTL